MIRRAALALAAVVFATAAAPVPRRVVSLNLCTDELALLLAAPGQLASVSRLGADPRETTLSARAAGLPVNNGRLEPILRFTPDLVLTSGGSPYATEMARRLGIPTVDIPFPSSLADVERNIRMVALALRRQARGETLIATMRRELGPVSPHPRTALFISGGGVSARADGLNAQWLRYAGLAIPGGTGSEISLEQLLMRPPQVLVLTRYRTSEASLNQSWLSHPALRHLPRTTRVVTIDGRGWTCLGPTVAGAVVALRESLRNPLPSNLPAPQ